MTKLAILSDIHGNLTALEAVLADVALHGVDGIVNLGDIVSGPLQAAGTLDLLMQQNITTIRGNHERQLLALLDAGQPLDLLSSDGFAAAQLSAAHIAWLRALPATQLLQGDILLCHGTPASDLAYWLETVVPGYARHGDAVANGVRPATPAEVAARLGDVTPALVVCGHTHVARIVASGASLIVNPGSVGLQAYDDEHPLPHVIESGLTSASYALVERRDGVWYATLRQVPYDHLAQARLAAERGRRDWAQALATGRALRF